MLPVKYGTISVKKKLIIKWLYVDQSFDFSSFASFCYANVTFQIYVQILKEEVQHIGPKRGFMSNVKFVLALVLEHY